MREVWVSTDVSSEPVSSAEAKLFAKIPSTADDTVVAYLIKAAREAVEQYTGLSLAPKTVIAEWDELPDGDLELPYGPVSQMVYALRVLTTGDESENITYYEHGTIWKKLQLFTTISPGERLKLSYIVGYGASGCPSLPSTLKTCILKEIATQYQYRENLTEGMTRQNEWQKLAAPYRRGI